MANFEINILGCGSATPSLRHMPSCQVIDFRDKLLMIDCGEGAQLGMRRQSLKFSRLNDIYISHLHGDHFLGLPGLLSTMALHQKEGTVTVHISEKGADILSKIMDVFCSEHDYRLEYDILPKGGGVIKGPKGLLAGCFPLYHRVETYGFKFTEEPKLRHINGEMARYHQVPVFMMESLRRGEDFVKPDGTVIPNAYLTTAPDPCVSYAYCSDTAYNPRVAEAVKGVTALYHEATYTSENEAKAHDRGHSTAREAAMIARDAGAGMLLLGHYSKRYDDTEVFAREAAEIFPNVKAVTEGMKIDLL